MKFSRVIDFHAHIYPEKIAAKAAENIGAFYSTPMAGKGTPEDLAALGKEGGIDRFVVCSAAGIPGQVGKINDFIAAACTERNEKAAAGEGPFFTGFGTLHPDFPSPAEEIDRMISLGLEGVKFHPDMQKFAIDDERMMKIYAALEGRLPVLFHTGDYRYGYSHPEKLAKVLDAFPRLTAIGAHFGGWSMPEKAYECFKNRSCFFDVSSSLGWYLDKKEAAALIRRYGAERFFFGSDYPMWNPGKCLEEFLSLDLNDTEKEKILYKNAENFLGLQVCK